MLNIEQKNKELLEKRSRLAQEKDQQLDLTDLYKNTFRRLEKYCNDYRNKGEYSYCNDIDIEEDLFDDDEGDNDDDDNDDYIMDNN